MTLETMSLTTIQILLVPIGFLICISVKASFWLGFLYFRGETSVPGPILARFSRLWLLRALGTGKSAEIFAEVSREYGNLARIGPNHVLTNDTETVRRILARDSPYVRSAWFDSLKIDPRSTNIIAERDPKKHAALRYKLAPVYSGKALGDVESKVNCLLAQWVQVLHQYGAKLGTKGNKLNLAKSIQYLVVDIISKIALGASFGNVENSSDTYGFLTSIHGAMPASLMTSALPEVHAIARQLSTWSWIHRLLIPAPTDQQGVGKILGIIEAAIEERLESRTEKRSDMMEILLDKGLTRGQLREELLISLVAGSETTTTALQGIILSIISDARVYVKLTAEIDAALDVESPSKPIEYKEIRKLPYLQACIMEGLRKFPPIGQLRERVVPPGGDVVLGHFLKEGTYIGFDSIGLQSSSIFGNDTESFRPERWLITDTKRLEMMHRVNDLVFGHGSTRCLGADIALMEINKVLFELFRNFHISVMYPMKPCKRTCWGVFVSEDLYVNIQPRA